MKTKTLTLLLGLALIIELVPTSLYSANPAEIVITRDAELQRLIPISITGFTGEALSVLKFDLELVGFTNASPSEAQFLIEGSNDGNLQGKVIDRINKTPILAKSYSGGTIRAQAHAFADEIVNRLRGEKGIFQTKIAFRVRNDNASEIYVSDFDGHNIVQVTHDNSIALTPAWFPGKRILYYTSYIKGNPDIYRHDLTTGERTIIARYSGLNTCPAVSPDGKKLAMILSKAGSPDLYVSDINGQNLVRLTTTRAAESTPSWSPDSKYICFSSQMSGASAIYTIPASGGQPKRVSFGISNATEPNWSPDGKYIIFTANMRDFQICITPATGGTAEVLVQGESPCWAPNSRTVAFVRRSGGRKYISLLDVPTKKVKNIVQMSGDCSQPSWAK